MSKLYLLLTPDIKIERFYKQQINFNNTLKNTYSIQASMTVFQILTTVLVIFYHKLYLKRVNIHVEVLHDPIKLLKFYIHIKQILSCQKKYFYSVFHNNCHLSFLHITTYSLISPLLGYYIFHSAYLLSFILKGRNVKLYSLQAMKFHWECGCNCLHILSPRHEIGWLTLSSGRLYPSKFPVLN